MKITYRKLIIFIVIFFVSDNTFSQEIWAGGTIKIPLSKKSSATFENQFRFHDFFSSHKSTFTEIGYAYKINRHFKLKAALRYSDNPGTIQNDDRDEDHKKRIAFDFIYSPRFENLLFSLRMRYQLTQKQETGKNYNYLRNKFGVEYDLSKYAIPFISFELYYRLDDKNEIRGTKFMLGLNSRITKQMQNKGAIKLFAVALALVSLYQLSFTWITNSVENDAVEFAQGNPEKEADYLDSIAGETVYNFLWVKEFTYRDCQEREINLGLDLKGGMNVTLEVSVIDLIRALSNYSTDSTFVSAMARTIEYQKESQEDFVTLFGQAFEDIDPNAKLAAVFNTLELKDRIGYNSTNEEVLLIIREETDAAINNSFNILRNRIDRFGVTQPNIQRLETAGRILVELPGVKDPDRVRKLLQGTANLEFWETYDITEVYPFLEQANTRLREMSEINKVAEEDVSDEDIGAEDETDEELTAEEETDKEVAATEEEVVESEVIQEEDSTDLLDKIADGELEKEIESETPDTTDEEVSLLDELEKDTTKAESEAETYEQYKIQNPLFGILTISSYEGRLAQGTAAVGTALSKDTSKINEYLQRKQIKELFPRELKFLWEVKPITDRDKQPTDFYRLVAIKITNRDGKPALGGDVITNAREQFGQNQATAEVHMTMNGEGAKVWARLTRENKGKQIAVVLDNYVYTFPTVQDEITGGSSQITGNFSISEAKDLANILKSGKLPAPARIIEEEIVGPSLGKEAINSGLISFVIAFILVLIFMAFYYKTAGTVADIALLANIFFIFGVLASLGAVLTLPGIAGMVLTIGMSIDANVLIYERIREEVTAGKGLKLAISDGYKNAYSAIIDSNVTTLLTGIILLIFGHGPIKGFATTLIIGILTSLFSAIFITRLVFIYLLDKKWQIGFSIKMTANVMKNTTIDFLGNRKRFYAISAIIILIGLVSLFTRGLNQGVDFMGGRTYVVRFDKDVSTVDIATNLKDAYGTAPEVKTFGGNNQVKITTKYRIEETDPEVDIDVETKLFEGIKHLFGSDITYNDFVKDHRMSSQKVGPTIADDIKIAAVYSILFALLMMFLYIFMRFRDWRFGLGALAALTHDVLIVLGLFSLLYGVLPFSLEIDQAFIAAILTVVGYSVNDSVVVFDRIREYITLHPKRDKSSVYNLALNSTLSRTIITSFTSFLVLLSIFIFGGAVIRGFIFALLIGIVVGTYSSLFVATPLVFDTVKKIQKQVDKYKDRKAKRKKSK